MGMVTVNRVTLQTEMSASLSQYKCELVIGLNETCHQFPFLFKGFKCSQAPHLSVFKVMFQNK